jgi:hypothetical protein
MSHDQNVAPTEHVPALFHETRVPIDLIQVLRARADVGATSTTQVLCDMLQPSAVSANEHCTGCW